MQQDNIKDFAIAAFRYRGHLNDTDILSLEEVYINMAVTSTHSPFGDRARLYCNRGR